MEGKSSESSQNHNGEEAVVEDLKGKPMIGDLTWVKLSAGSWWPALVVGSNEDSGKSTKGVRVRLYGSFEYMLVDPSKWLSEFETILNENNGCYQEIFRKTLEKEMLRSKERAKRSKSKGTSNGRVSEERTTSYHERSSSRKQTKNDGVKRKTRGNSKRVSSKNDGTQNEDGEISGRTPELSARRIRVMQSLGLAAPSGSPFKNGLFNPSF